VNERDATLLKQLKDLLERRISLHELVLFGSRARGDAEPDSDMDVLVVVDGLLTKAVREAVSECAWEVGFEAGIVIASVVVSRDSWENGVERASLLARAVEKEGVRI
jgi:uncharacterized protein